MGLRETKEVAMKRIWIKRHLDGKMRICQLTLVTKERKTVERQARDSCSSFSEPQRQRLDLLLGCTKQSGVGERVWRVRVGAGLRVGLV